MTAPDPVRRGALAALRTGRVTVLRVRDGVVAAAVRSSRLGGATYAVDREPDAFARANWYCTCTAGNGCAHILAVQMVTGHAPEVAA